MFVRTYVSDYLDSNCYVVYNDNYAIIIDPSVSYSIIRKNFKQKIVGIFITHGHFDHFIELDSYLKHLDSVKVYIHRNAKSKLENNHLNYYYSYLYNPPAITCDERFITVEEGHMKIGETDIDIIYTPGHSDCSYTILIDDMLFTGDFLFKGSIGRTDLYSGNSFIMSQTIKKILSLELLNKKDDYYLYPGHGEYTTLSNEKRSNYYLKMKI